jgi:predicted transcriptional regulator
MRKIGITLFTLLAVATSACAESPTASAAGAKAALSGGLRYAESADFGEAGGEAEVEAAEGTLMMTTMELARGPGLAGSGH